MNWIFVLCLIGMETSASTFAYFATRSRKKKQKVKQRSNKEHSAHVQQKNTISPATTTQKATALGMPGIVEENEPVEVFIPSENQ